MTYSYCESSTASGSSPWHIRRLTDLGQKFSGGIDTASLCKRVQPPYGWDLAQGVSNWTIGVCITCYFEWREENGAQPK